MAPFLAISWPGGSEWIIILLIVMLLFGSKKLPELARGLGRSMSEFKKGREEGEKEDKASASNSPESKTGESKNESKIS